MEYNLVGTNINDQSLHTKSWNKALNYFIDYALYDSPQYHHHCKDPRPFKGVHKDILDLEDTKTPLSTLSQSLSSPTRNDLMLLKKIIDDKKLNHPSLQKISLEDLYKVFTRISQVEYSCRNTLLQADNLCMHYQKAARPIRDNDVQLDTAIQYNTIDINANSEEMKRTYSLRCEIFQKINACDPNYLLSKIDEEYKNC